MGAGRDWRGAADVTEGGDSSYNESSLRFPVTGSD